MQRLATMNSVQRDQPRGPEPLMEVLAAWFTTRPWGRKQEHLHLEVAWREAVGPDLAAQTRPTRVRRGVLEILVSDAVLHQELALAKKELLHALKESLPNLTVTDLRFRIG